MQLNFMVMLNTHPSLYVGNTLVNILGKLYKNLLILGYAYALRAAAITGNLFLLKKSSLGLCLAELM